ncbi:hypothetical protein VA603_15895 [Stenotrophomonas sp. MH1]|uniref:Uncharacterized protein n=1 Tax=Stenotrophomonas capsici TaxID=3110230 RepID=A0ABU5V6P0_9GAMM|nr:hypothetical protein [Stenotrophomonas sp. MH1]MEA5669028.1 hypothetical protein [Stenotrophomonas sp. MH1]
MSDGKDFNETKKLLLQINEVVEKLDPAIRLAAFEMLTSMYFSKKQTLKRAASGGTVDADDDSGDAPDTGDLGAFVQSFETGKPHEALEVLVAWLYSQRGNHPFTTSELKALADECGMIVPGRPDMTFKGAKANGKAIYIQSGKNWKLTVSGEMHMRATYKVTKGKANGSED